MLVHWIWLAHRPAVTERMTRQLLERFCDAQTIFRQDRKAYLQVEGLTEEALASLEDKNLLPSEQLMDRCAREGIHLLTLGDTAYPVRLKHIPDPPILLYYKGKLPDFDDNPVIGVVGTRRASAYGLQTARQLGYQIGKCGGIVVSGLADGIDAMAMSGAILSGRETVGVLGCGIDQVYPACNRKLYQDTERYGCILSEYGPGTPPLRHHFPRRNRIISGLSCAVLVVEAPENSGALITANRALDQGRDVFVVPGNIDNPCCFGSNRLLREGATAVSSGWDILSEYEGRFPDKIHLSQAVLPEEKLPRETQTAAAEPVSGQKKRSKKAASGKKKTDSGKQSDKIVVDKEQNTPYIDLNNTQVKLSEDEKTIINALRSGQRQVDDVIAETGLSTGKVLSAMTILELKGVLTRLPGKRIELRRTN